MWKKQKEIKKYLDDRGWTERNPANLAKSIMIEGAELLEHFQWTHPSKETVRADKEKLAEIKHEIADVVIYCFDMAVALDFDLESAISEKLALIEKKYPIEKVKGNGAEYYKIKKAYRAKKK